MSLLARGWPSLTLEQNVGQGSWKLASLARCLPGVVLPIRTGWPRSVLPVGPEPRPILGRGGIPSSCGPERGPGGPGPAPGQRWGGEGHIRKAAWLKGAISLWGPLLLASPLHLLPGQGGRRRHPDSGWGWGRGDPSSSSPCPCWPTGCQGGEDQSPPETPRCQLTPSPLAFTPLLSPAAPAGQ